MKLLPFFLAFLIAGCSSTGIVLPSDMKFDELTLKECKPLVKTESGKDLDLIRQQKENAKIYKECEETNKLKLNVLRSLSSK